MEQIELKVCGLDCPNCAQKIADKVNAMPEVKSAELDFMRNRFTVEPAAGTDMETVKNLVKTVIRKTEPAVRISDYRLGSSHTGHSHAGHSHAGHDHAGHSHGDEEENEELHKSDVIAIAAALVLFFASIFVPVELVSDILAIAAYVLAGWEVVFSAVRGILKGQAFDESFLMTVATVGAFALGDFREGAAVMIFYQVGEIFQVLAVQKSKKSITKLMELKPEFAMLKTADGFEKKAPEDIITGDVILVRAGEKIPLDGVIAKGASSLDTSVLTGESLPVEVAEGAEVLSGSVNLNGTLEIRVTSPYTESAVAKILDMVQNSATKKAKTEKFITRFARIYTPVVVAAAVLLAFVPPFLLGLGSFSQWLYRGLVFLVVSCPCALVISVPLGFFAGIGGASHRGILIKGAKNIEALAACKTVAFDKTGTLTYGRFEVTDLEPAQGVSEAELLQTAAVAESASNHPIARSVVKRYGGEIPAPARADERAGNGILAVLGGETILCGKREFLAASGIAVPEETALVTKTAVYTAKAGRYLGRILLSDVMKKTTAAAVTALEGMGIGTVLLTGDKEAPAREIAKQAGIRSVYSGLLPGEKVGIVEQLLADSGKRNVIFTGDGINDAPVIARADVGIAMGGAGSDIAIEAADVVLMEDEPVRIPEAVKISRRTMRIVRQNIIFAIGVKVAVMALSTFGLAGMWAAVFADVGVTVIAILNSLRALRVPDFTLAK